MRYLVLEVIFLSAAVGIFFRQGVVGGVVAVCFHASVAVGCAFPVGQTHDLSHLQPLRSYSLLARLVWWH